MESILTSYIELLDRRIKNFNKKNPKGISNINQDYRIGILYGFMQARAEFVKIFPEAEPTIETLDLTIYQDDDLDTRFKKTLLKFAEFRKKIKKPIKEASKEQFLKKLIKYSENNKEIAIEILNNSIANGWQGIFPLTQTIKSGKQIFGE